MKKKSHLLLKYSELISSKCEWCEKKEFACDYRKNFIGKFFFLDFRFFLFLFYISINRLVNRLTRNIYQFSFFSKNIFNIIIFF